MTLTKEDGDVILGAIEAELQSQYWRQVRREQYNDPEIEREMQKCDAARAEQLKALRGKIKRQIRNT